MQTVEPHVASPVGAAAVTESTRRSWPHLLALAAQNLGIYWAHYFSTAGIPWDFSMAYYAMVAFWTSTVREGVVPQWLPFQQMGYPFALQAQSGMTYLPFWIFPALNVPYTLRAAIVFQCLHVLLGSAGMFMLSRQWLGSRRLALIAGVAFQCFGGFYSNAEHPDIVRAFAYAPWLLYAFSVGTVPTARLPRRAMLIPPVLYLFLTGAYPGNVIAAGVVLGIFVFLQLAQAAITGTPPVRLAGLTARLAGLGLLGCGMASVHLGPLTLFREHYSRGEPLLGAARFGLGLDHLPGLFLTNATLPGEVSMTSTYVTLPIVILACFAPLAAIRKYWVLAAVAAASALLAAGDLFALGPFLRALFPLLGLSRFPSSDYRVFVAIPLILFGVAGLRAASDTPLSRASLAGRSLFCLTWVAWSIAHVHGGFSRESVAAWAVGAAALLLALAVWRRPPVHRDAAAAALLLLVVVDAVRVLPNVPGWREPDMDAYYQRQGEPPYTRNRGRRLAPASIAGRVPPVRPARTRPAGLIRWSGYLDGTYNVADLTPNVLRAAVRVAADEWYGQYMMRGWSPLLLSEPAGTGTVLTLTRPGLEAALDTPTTESGFVRQTRYGINDIEYKVSLPAPRLLIENEMYFPGWRARLGTHDGATIEAVEVNGIFRGWRLPAGEYAMTASFQLPHLRSLGLVTVASSAVWIGICGRLARRRRLERS